MSDDEGKTIIRKHRKSGFVVLPNALVQDSTMTWAETGLMAYLLSLPDDWEVRTADLVNRKANGRDAVRRLYRLLEEKGYIQITRVAGTPPKQVIHVFDEPMPVALTSRARETRALTSRAHSKDTGKKEHKEQRTPLPPSGGKLPRRALCSSCHVEGTVGVDLSRFTDSTAPYGKRTQYLHAGCKHRVQYGVQERISTSDEDEDWL